MAITKIWDHRRPGKWADITDSRQSVSQGIFYAENPEKTTEKTLKNQAKSEPEGVVASVAESLSKGVNYAENEEKTVGKKELENCFLADDECVYVSGYGCTPGPGAVRDFIMVKEKFDDMKPSITHFHAVQSFHGHECSPDIAHEIGCKLAEKLWADRFQVVVCTHLNTENVHNHFIINATSFVDGKRFYDNKSNYYQLRRASDLLCEEYGLSVIEDRRGKAISRRMNELENKGAPTRLNIARAAIDMALDWARNLDEMKMILNEIDFEADFSPAHKHWTIRSKGWQKPIRLKRIADKYGEGYTKRGILLRLDDEKKTPEDADTEEMLELFRKAFSEESRIIGIIEEENKPDLTQNITDGTNGVWNSTPYMSHESDKSVVVVRNAIGQNEGKNRTLTDKRKGKSDSPVLRAYISSARRTGRLKYFDRSRPLAKGLHAYYLRWLFRLGVLPRRRKIMSSRYGLFVHYSVRDDLLNIKHILYEAKIISRNRIESFDDLYDHVAKLQTEIEELERQIRSRKVPQVDKEEMKKKLKEKRKELSYCDHITERSLRLDEGLTKEAPQKVQDYTDYYDNSMLAEAGKRFGK